MLGMLMFWRIHKVWYLMNAGDIQTQDVINIQSKQVMLMWPKLQHSLEKRSTLLTMNKVDNTISKLCAVQVTKTQNWMYWNKQMEAGRPQ